MCGIYGIVSPAGIKDNVDARRDTMVHRGPDGAGTWFNTGRTVALAHRRLSIIDLTEESRQPFVFQDEGLAIVFNGEIYNFLEIREELKEQGAKFRSTGDTEVVLAAYNSWGIDCVHHLNGMFSFAVYDSGKHAGKERLFFARDRAGEKPLYYRHVGGRFVFASELKAIGNFEGIDLNALNHYLALGYVPFDLCIAKGVKKLPPAHAGMFDIRSGGLKTWRYWHPPWAESAEDLTGEQLAEESWKLLKDSVRLRLRSDVPVGVFLSGGLDSSLVTAAAAVVSGQTIKTFTTAVPGSRLDESAHARLVAESFGTDHHVLKLSEPSLDVLNELAPYVDEPLADSSILPTYLVSKLTAQYVKVALGGDGGDELYGGYRHYQQPLIDNARIGLLPKSILQAAATLAARLPAGVRGRNRLASLRDGVYHSPVWGTPYFDVDLRKRILKPEIVHELGEELDHPEQALLGLMAEGKDIVDSLTRSDFNSVLPDDFLVKVDRASMANSLEVRSPFLDYRLVEHAFVRIPSFWKVNRAERRRVQNIMAKRHLPQGYELNRKQGFSIPMDEWLRKINPRERLGSVLDFVNKKELEHLVKGQMNGRANGARLFALIMLNISMSNGRLK